MTRRHRPFTEKMRGDLSDYFRFEDLGPPAISTEPRAGTCSLKPRPPEWPPQADKVLMAVVYRRLTHAQQYIGPNIFAILRARYGAIRPRDKVSLKELEQPKTVKLIDHAEDLYALSIKAEPWPDSKAHQRRRQQHRWERHFGK